MNLLLISGSHPDIAHVSAIRAWQFARGLAALGHRTMMLCPARNPADEIADLTAALAGHDWHHPFLLATGGLGTPPPSRSPVISRLRTAAAILRSGGHRGPWARRAAATMFGLGFRPDAIWATFGNLENLLLARRLARHFDIPWIADVKDDPRIYLPASLRRIVAWRLRGCAGLHCNARGRIEVVRRWLGTEPEVVYSGVDTAFFADARPPLPVPARRLVLAGSLYGRDRLAAFLQGVADHNRLDPQAAFDLLYLGHDGEALRAAAAPQGDAIRIATPGYVDAAEMARCCRASSATVSLTLDENFHHKLLEFFACNRPVIAFGGEHPESSALAEQCGARLHIPETAAELTALLGTIADAPADSAGVPPAGSTFFTWAQQSAQLERSIKRMTGHDR